MAVRTRSAVFMEFKYWRIELPYRPRVQTHLTNREGSELGRRRPHRRAG
jgi:hypothetical protein